ncbi:MAG: 2-C-methyl-D-erythritol 2,4-cyclodiphosphate synthase [Eubacteriales bacterium SKADARSKE-1]|nr:2-C-methyl-D-erythritol 2,4-cyclodiphosphate synthase [Eubacteriales bacterium SKADARSKE-1]
MRVGHGYDVHKFAENRKLILGGCTIDFNLGLLGHSDADVLVHAVMDALLGAAALGDIGIHFPDNNPTYKNANSIELLKRVCKKLKHEGHSILNIDSTIIAQNPKIASYIPNMKKNIATACNILETQVNIKATTEEGLGFTGEMKGIAAHSVALLESLT